MQKKYHQIQYNFNFKKNDFLLFITVYYRYWNESPSTKVFKLFHPTAPLDDNNILTASKLL